MAVSHRVTGTWAELTADGSVAIPATPQAGDRMFLFARWKDFSITATVANWTELTEFADGSVTSGNGTGSVKVGCWYRDWQSGDSNPTIDFSANPTNASVVITVMQKAADDVWDMPAFRTAAMTTWTTTSQSVSASATVTVRSSGVVIGLIGIRDDTATMTRPTSGIDDSGGVVTWNGDYVESPASHHSTTTGDDGAADLGYRLVTTGATATLRMTGTISAAETGAALWVIQGVIVAVTPSPASFSYSTFTPSLTVEVTPSTASLAVTSLSPTLTLAVNPEPRSLQFSTTTPVLALGIAPDPASFALTGFSPTLALHVMPATVNLAIISLSPLLISAVMPPGQALNVMSLVPVLALAVIPQTPSFALRTFKPIILPFNLNWLDPGGDAVQLPGYFNNDPTPGLMTFDNTQQVVGVGSYRFDSDTGVAVIASVSGVLGQSRRVSCYFRYDSIPDELTEHSEFLFSTPDSPYSGGGFLDVINLQSDEGIYATASPARNSGQGSRCELVTPLFTTAGNAIIDSVKIIYERKYDTDSSIGISRVKWVVGGVEGPDHDNTDMPLTDTVVEVDVTNDRFWEPQDLHPLVFEVVVEARRGDTDTAHTQSWDYAKVEVVYHTAPTVLAAMDGSNHTLFDVALNPRGDRSVFRFTDGDHNSFDGISSLFVDAWNRISFSYVLNSADDLYVKVYVNGIEELSIEGASTGGFTGPLNLLHGWVTSPGVNHLCWFEQLYIDNGDDLSDTGNRLSTYKGPAGVNEDEWDTTVGTGAVNERPLSETNLRRHNAATSARQTYTLQTADEGDVDISGETLLGYMVWVWAKMHTDGDEFFLVANGVEVNRNSQIRSTPSLLRHAVSSSVYPSAAAGVGARTNEEGVDTYLYECGAVVAYEGSTNPDILLPWQRVADETLDTIIDDLRADSPDSYELCYIVDEFDGTVSIEAYSIDAENNPPQLQGTMQSAGGKGRLRVTSGIEVQIVVTIVGVTMLTVYRRLNVD